MSGNDQALLNCCGVDDKDFCGLLDLFEPVFDIYTIDKQTKPIRKQKNNNGLLKGRKREANATCCLGLVLHWFCTKGSVTKYFSLAFGLTSSVVYTWLKFSQKVLVLMTLQNHPKAMGTAPTEKEINKLISTIGAKYPILWQHWD
eukprot:jgi/Psemu1/5359/gm1.5359_g